MADYRRLDPGAHDFHFASAAGAAWRGPFFCRTEFKVGYPPKQQLDQFDLAFAVRVQKAEVAGAAEALGQNVLHDQV